jgi:hypothetical protein
MQVYAQNFKDNRQLGHQADHQKAARKGVLSSLGLVINRSDALHIVNF